MKKYILDAVWDVDTDEPGVFILNLPYGFRFDDSHEDNPEHIRGFDSMREVRDSAKNDVIPCNCRECAKFINK